MRRGGPPFQQPRADGPGVELPMAHPVPPRSGWCLLGAAPREASIHPSKGAPVCSFLGLRLPAAKPADGRRGGGVQGRRPTNGLIVRERNRHLCDPVSGSATTAALARRDGPNLPRPACCIPPPASRHRGGQHARLAGSARVCHRHKLVAGAGCGAFLDPPGSTEGGGCHRARAAGRANSAPADTISFCESRGKQALESRGRDITEDPGRGAA